MKWFITPLTLLASLGSLAHEATPVGTLVDFQVQVDATAPNDLAMASAYLEATGAQPGELARRVNKAMADALNIAKAQTEVKVKSGGTHTYPVYGKASRAIESWRMRSEIRLESRDTPALSELLGRLQGTLAVGNVSFAPAPETRRKIEDEAALDAIARFQDKAARYAAAMKKTYRIRSLNIQGSHAGPVYAMRAMPMAAMADAAPMPMEAGDSTLTVTVSGQVELN